MSKFLSLADAKPTANSRIAKPGARVGLRPHDSTHSAGQQISEPQIICGAKTSIFEVGVFHGNFPSPNLLSFPRESINPSSAQSANSVTMPSLEAESHGIPAVASFKVLLDELLQHAQTVKASSSIEPPLKRTDFEDLQTKLRDVFPMADPSVEEGKGDKKKARRFAVIETAARDTLSSLIVSE